MTNRRVTRCLTWGEEKATGFPLLDNQGKRIGFIDLREWITLCGASDKDPKEACGIDVTRLRPKGICPKCWSVYKLQIMSLT